MKYLTIHIDETMDARPVRSVLLREGGMASSYISSLKFREQGLLRNGEAVRTNALLCAGDVLCARIDDEQGRNEAEPMAVPLDFVWEDEYLAVLNKGADMAVHGSLRGGACTVANALAALWGRSRPSTR